MASGTFYVAADTDDGYLSNGTTWYSTGTIVLGMPVADACEPCFRVVNVTIPWKAVINSAHFHYYIGTNYGSQAVRVRGILGDCPSLSSNPSGYTKTTASATFSTYNGTGWAQSVDITSVIQEIVDGTWDSGYDLGLWMLDNGFVEYSNQDLTGYSTAWYLDVDYSPIIAINISPSNPDYIQPAIRVE